MTGAVALGLEVLLYFGGFILFSGVIYSLFLSPGSKKHFIEHNQQRAGRFERREKERPDRRRNDEAPPHGVDRRSGPRRDQDV